MICAVHVSGFYHGKLRGILGDANNEPYDDYTLPSGKVCICRVVAKFFNAFLAHETWQFVEVKALVD